MSNLEPSRALVRGLPVDHLRAMRGLRLQRVTYLAGSEPVVDPGADRTAPLHEVDQAVVITTEHVSTVLEWSLPGYDEFLHVTGSRELAQSRSVGHRLDATGLPQWRPLLGAAITSFGVATHRSEESAELLWALRIDTARGHSVVVSLAELRNGLLSYQPDNLAVIFKPEVARALRLPDSGDPAWGRDLQ